MRTVTYDATATRSEYWCIFCRRALPVVDGVIVHDGVPHDIGITFDEEDNPQ